MTIMDNRTYTLAVRLRKSRILANLEQAELAEMLGISRGSVSNYETGKSEPIASMFVRWAQLTDVPLEWLAEGVNARTAPAEAGAVEVVHPLGLEPRTH
ncbi:helix-turn-helix domain-containing protein [Plantibacter flavus]|uniref:helix-turn-helix domain-containing protein n=1 Tax=Plantibacter flavus TaxID=150123 RepID=UPI003F1784CF